MASEVGSIAVRVGADVSSLKRGLSEGSASVGSFSSSSRAGLNKVAGSILKVGAAAAAAGAAITVHMVNNARAAIDAQAKMAQQLDTTSASLATLQRAGQLSGVEMKSITTASRTLSVRIGEAEQGLASAKDAFDQLGISAATLVDMPLDQRISTINNALLNNVDASQRAAVAADLFGTRASTAIKMLTDGTLDQARKETELFGLALSDVDAAKVELANDALSTIGNALDGISQQLTIQVAPILQAVGQLFVDSAEEAGGLGNSVDKAFDSIVSGAAFAMNAVDGLKRLFEIVGVVIGTSITAGIAALATPLRAILELADAAASAFGDDTFSSSLAAVSQFQSDAVGMVAGLGEEIDGILMRPLEGDKFKKFVEDAKVAGQVAAEAAVAAREAVVGGSGGDESAGSPRSDAELKAIATRIEAIRAANATELELLNEKYAAETEAMTLALESKQITQDQAYALSIGAAERYASGKLSIEQDAAAREIAIAKQKEDSKKAIMSQAFGGLTSLMNSESRKMFEIGKAAAISQAVVSTYSGMAKALELGWPLGPIAAGAIALNGFGQVANIRKQSFGGGGATSATGSTTGQINAAATQTGGSDAGNDSGPRQVVNVALNGQFFSREMVRDMLPMIGEELQDGGVLGSVG